MSRRKILQFLVIICISFSLFLLIAQNFVYSASTNLTVSAAISLKDALTEIKPIFEKIKPNINITYNFGSSGSLQQQIQQGAPVDVFFSAATKQMDGLEAKNLLLPNTRKNLLSNQIVLIVPKDSKIKIMGFSDLKKTEVKRIALGEPKSVPAGQYSEEILKFYNLLDALKSKIIYTKDVRQVLTYVSSGNVDAGLVYVTDAKTSTQVKVVATALSMYHQPIIYPVAVIKGSKKPQAAQDFVNFLATETAKKVFTKYGFIPI